MSKAPPDGSRSSVVHPKPPLILGEDLVGGGLGIRVCGAGDPGHAAGSFCPPAYSRDGLISLMLQRLKEKITDVFLWRGEASRHFILPTSGL